MTEPEALYIHLLFALKDRNLGILEANFAQLVYSGLLALEAQWKLLVDDIEHGRVNTGLEIEDEVRRLVGLISEIGADEGQIAFILS